MKLSDFDFELPESLIAQKPSPERGQSRLMVIERKTGNIYDDQFSSLPNYLKTKPLLVFNNTQVLPAKIIGVWKNTKRVSEILLVEEIKPKTWSILVKGLGKFKSGDVIEFSPNCCATFLKKKEDLGILQFSDEVDVQQLMNTIGRFPLPHYIRRNVGDDQLEALDKERYQTVFAKFPGSIAAPTAGLHFSDSMMESLKSKFQMTFLTLQVGPGTFQPIRTENITQHKMKKEYFQISSQTWNTLFQTKQQKTKILSVGTTTTRVLESIDIQSNRKNPYGDWTERFIYPGQTFKNTDHLITNFHLPKSSLYLLVCAFGSPSLIQKAYQQAIQKKYRFYSYGDAMLIL